MSSRSEIDRPRFFCGGTDCRAANTRFLKTRRARDAPTDRRQRSACPHNDMGDETATRREWGGEAQAWVQGALSSFHLGIDPFGRCLSGRESEKFGLCRVLISAQRSDKITEPETESFTRLDSVMLRKTIESVCDVNANEKSKNWENE